ncbi:MAG: hypothetical protein GXZ11_02880 [Tissierellia bacterium]|nr:hypothetical protein [Tissierellia bacterium]
MNSKRFASKFLIALIMLAMIFQTGAILVVDAKSYPTDIAGHWAEKTIEEALDKGQFKGYEDGTFKPEKSLTVAEFTTLVARALGIEVVSAEGHWAEGTFRKLFADKVLLEAEYGRETWDKPITRAQAAKLLKHMLEKNLSEKEAVKWDIKDLSTIEEQYLPFVKWCLDRGLLAGDEVGQFSGDDYITRAQSVVVVQRIVNKIEASKKVEEVKSSSGTGMFFMFSFGDKDNSVEKPDESPKPEEEKPVVIEKPTIAETHEIASEDIVAEEVLKGEEVDLTDNINSLPEGSKVTHDEFTANTPGDYEVEVTLEFSDGSKTKVKVLVVVKALMSETHEIAAEDIVAEEVLKGEEVDLTDNIKNLPEGTKVEHEEFIADTPGEHEVEVTVEFSDGSEVKVNIPVKVTLKPEDAIDEATGLPLKYDLREHGFVTPIRNQFKDGACRSFAALGALESHILKSTGKSMDLSENNMENRQGYYYKLGPRTGRVRNTDLAYLLNGKGPILEFQDPYFPLVDEKGGQKLYDDEGNEIPLWTKEDLEDSRYDPVYKSRAKLVTGMQFLKTIKACEVTAPNDVKLAQIKGAIKAHGAVVSNIYMSHDGRGLFPYQNDTYFNEETNAYYADGKDGKYPGYANHAITIVGWDDTFSKDNFKTKPAIDGAWIVKDAQGKTFGEEGFFYVSYQSVSICEEPYVFTEVKDADAYDGMYLHDDLPFTSYLRHDSFSDPGKKTILFNRFSVKNKARELAAIGFYTTKPGAEYSVYLIPDFETIAKFEGNSADYDEIISTIQPYLIEEGTKDTAGYHVINLSEEQKVALKYGKDFAIGIHTRNNDQEDPEHQWDFVMELKDDNIGLYADNRVGETYMMSDGSLRDIGKTHGNATVKGYYIQNELPTEYRVTFYSGDIKLKTLFVEEGDKVEKIDDPEKQGYIFKGWYTDAELAAEYDFEASIIKDTNIYAKWEKDEEEPVPDAEYEVAIHKGDGSNSVIKKQIPSGNNLVATMADIKTAHKYGVFQGWYTDPQFQHPLDVNAPVTGEMKIYGKYQPYKVQFDLTEDPDGEKEVVEINMSTGRVAQPETEEEVYMWYIHGSDAEFFVFNTIKSMDEPDEDFIVLKVYPAFW